MLLMEPRTQRVQRCIFTSPEQTHDCGLPAGLRSISSNGKLLQTCAATFGFLHGTDRLTMCAMSLEAPMVECIGINRLVNEPQVCGRFAQELVNARLRRCLVAPRGWPANQARFLTSPRLLVRRKRSIFLGSQLIEGGFQRLHRCED